MPAGRTPASSVSAASVMESVLLVVQTSNRARRLYSNTPNSPRCNAPSSERSIEGETGGWAAKVPLLHQAQAEGIPIRLTVADLDGRKDHQDQVHDAQDPQ